MRILAWDTTGPRGQLVAREGAQSLALEWSQEKTQSEWLFRSLQAACDALGWEFASIQRIGVVVGPGSFTGIRVGIAVARAWRAVYPHVEACSATALALQWDAFPQAMKQASGLRVVRPAATGEVYGRASREASREDVLWTVSECQALAEHNPESYWVLEGGEGTWKRLMEKGAVPSLVNPRVLDWDRSALSRWAEDLSLGGMTTSPTTGDWAPHYLREPDATRNLRKRLAHR